jgi:hypothetical protein
MPSVRIHLRLPVRLMALHPLRNFLPPNLSFPGIVGSDLILATVIKEPESPEPRRDEERRKRCRLPRSDENSRAGDLRHARSEDVRSSLSSLCQQIPDSAEPRVLHSKVPMQHFFNSALECPCERSFVRLLHVADDHTDGIGVAEEDIERHRHVDIRHRTCKCGILRRHLPPIPLENDMGAALLEHVSEEVRDCGKVGCLRTT